MTAVESKKHGRIGAHALFGTVFTNVCIQACTIFQGILLARLLGPLGRGEFAAVILWPSFFAAIGAFGLGTALARLSARESNLLAVTRSGLLLGLVAASITTIICCALLPLLLRNQGVHLLGASQSFLPFILLNHLAMVFVSIDQGSRNFRRYNWTRLIVNPVYLALALALWLLGCNSVFWFVMALLAANGVVVLVRSVELLQGASLRGLIYPLGPIARDAFKFGLADLLRPLYQFMDKALLLYLLGVENLGIYTVAFAASGVAGGLASATGSVSFGIAAQEDEPHAFARVARLFRCSCWIWFGSGCILALAMPVLLPLVFGREFAPAIWPAILLIPASAFGGQSGILEQSLRAQGRAFVGLEAQLAGMVVMVPLAFLGAKFYGIVGVVLAYGLSQLVCLCIFCACAKSHFRQPVRSLLIPNASDLKGIYFHLSHSLYKRFKLNLRTQE